MTFSVSAPARAQTNFDRAVDPADWPSYGRTSGEQHYSPLDQITKNNIGRLGLAWSFDFEEYRAVQGTPIVVDGVLYAIESWSKVHALDAKTGKRLWSFDPEVPRAAEAKGCCGPVSRGLAAANGKIFVTTFDGRLVALNAKSGTKIWETLTVDPAWPYTITGAPRVFKGKVVVGNAGADLGVRGYVSAYDPDTGKQLWRFYTVPGDPSQPFENDILRMAAKTWTGEWWKYGGGGSVWDSMSYDPELDLLYIGVGNGSPWNQHVRSPGGGDNLFLASIVALRPDTGDYVWHYQTVPGDTWDYTATQTMILADLTIGGESRKVLMQAPKNGFVYVLDRVTGKLISAERHAPATWAARIDPETGRAVVREDARYANGARALVSPPGDGATDGWQPAAFDPASSLMFFRSISAAQYWQDDATYQFARNYLNGGVVRAPGKVDPATAGDLPLDGYTLVGWDPVNQRAAWRSPQRARRNGGLLATGGGLLFSADAQDVVAYDSQSGKEIWAFNLHNRALAAPITYMIDGEQYVAIAAGSGFVTIQPGPVPRPAEMPNTNRVLVFKLDAKGALPDDKFPVVTLPVPPPKTGSAEQIAEGGRMYARYCYYCHGGEARGDRARPDLRFSPSLGDAGEWKSILIDGALSNLGMKSFRDVLNDDTAEALRLFVLDQAHQVQASAAPRRN